MKKIPWYQKTSVVIMSSFLGSLIGFASIAALLGVKSTDKLNKDYYNDSCQSLFESEEMKK